jgi:hypothetical protein
MVWKSYPLAIALGCASCLPSRNIVRAQFSTRQCLGFTVAHYHTGSPSNDSILEARFYPLFPRRVQLLDSAKVRIIEAGQPSPLGISEAYARTWKWRILANDSLVVQETAFPWGVRIALPNTATASIGTGVAISDVDGAPPTQVIGRQVPCGA